jgi:hypothetical protein
MELDNAMKEVTAEYTRALKKFGGFASRHEGYAVILEELDELWAEIKNNGTNNNVKSEAVQVTAMGLRLLVECCDKDKK